MPKTLAVTMRSGVVLGELLLEDLVKVSVRGDQSRSVKHVEDHINQFFNSLFRRFALLPRVAGLSKLDEGEEELVWNLLRGVAETLCDDQLAYLLLGFF